MKTHFDQFTLNQYNRAAPDTTVFLELKGFASSKETTGTFTEGAVAGGFGQVLTAAGGGPASNEADATTTLDKGYLRWAFGATYILNF